MIAQLLARHLRTPAGLFGRLVARLMNIGNRPMNLAALEALAVAPHHHILEIGFGGGSLLKALLDQTPEGKVVGLDISPTMVERARKLFKAAVENKHLVLTIGEVEELTFPDAAFDRILTVNTIYFWANPEKAARELRRVTAPQGRLVVGYGRVEDMKRLPPTRYNFRLYSPEEVERLMLDAGFALVRSEEFVTPKRSFILTTAINPQLLAAENQS
jgi:SAM-dependent methyltransferase